MSKMEGNDKLEQLLADVLSNTEAARAMAQEMGLTGGASAGGGKAATDEAANTGDE